jgi:tetratricopeptide (TPR) repeat protein
MEAFQARARHWSRTAWIVSLLFAGLTVASGLFVGDWGLGVIPVGFAILGTYFYLVSRPRYHSLPDGAALLDRAIRAARAGKIDKAHSLLTRAIRMNPRLWQAFQYRGELHLAQGNAEAAIEDFDEAIRLAPGEEHLRALRTHALSSDVETSPATTIPGTVERG